MTTTMSLFGRTRPISSPKIQDTKILNQMKAVSTKFRIHLVTDQTPIRYHSSRCIACGLDIDGDRHMR